MCADQMDRSEPSGKLLDVAGLHPLIPVDDRADPPQATLQATGPDAA